MKINKILTKSFLIAALCLLFIYALNIQVKAETVYTDGYYHYIVEDKSITITQYFGQETEVTVPSVIAGFPVSVIGKGAFVDAKNVQKINLPDTIMKVEQGAVKEGQDIIYAGNSDEKVTPAELESNKDSNTEQATQQTTNVNNQKSTSVQEVDVDDSKDTSKEFTIVDGKGNTITVDSDKHLIAKAPNGTMSILDDENEYKVENKKDGTAQITNSNGDQVTVDDQGKVVIPKKQKGNTMNSKLKVMIGVILLFIIGILVVSGIVIYRKKLKR